MQTLENMTPTVAPDTEKTPELNQIPTGNEFTDRLYMLWQMQESNPYADKALLRTSAVQEVYDELNQQIGHQDVQLKGYQLNVFAYLTAEVNLNQTQALVAEEIMKDEERYEEAVREVYDSLVNLRDTDPNANVEDIDDKIAKLTVTLERLENGKELPTGSELAAYVQVAKQAEAWGNQTIVKAETDSWEMATKEKLQLVKRAVDMIDSESWTCFMVAHRYPRAAEPSA